MAENRVTQVAVETLVGPGVANARLTQVAVETLVGPGVANARVTQVAVETLEQVGAAVEIRETQAALEHVLYPPNAIWQTQACLEVLFPADGFPAVTARNYAYTGLLART